MGKNWVPATGVCGSATILPPDVARGCVAACAGWPVAVRINPPPGIGLIYAQGQLQI